VWHGLEGLGVRELHQTGEWRENSGRVIIATVGASIRYHDEMFMMGFSGHLQQHSRAREEFRRGAGS